MPIIKNKKTVFAVAISAIAIGFALLHLFLPNLGIDFVTIALFAVAFLPWIFPMMKSFEIPGSFKIELRDTKVATDKITKIVPVSGSIRATSSIKGKLTIERKESDPILLLRQIAAADSNLAFVGFRVEIEKRLRGLAEKYDVRSGNQPISKLIRDLQTSKRIPPEVASGLSDLIALGNQAAHGHDVDPAAVNWLLDVGPSMLATLDDLLNQEADS